MSSEQYYEEGLNYFKERKYKEAIESFDKVIELAPNNSNAYYNRGVSKENLG
ncbi:tetratricopeptide repeat protein [Brachyspira hyodysenteriae]|nr:tetratricopeptide repeat protein [Brachyspira hyodysenteriae]